MRASRLPPAERTDEGRREPAPAPPANLLALQHAAGNVAVQRLLQRRAKKKPAPKPPLSLLQDGAGALHSVDAAGATQLVGTASQVAVDDTGEKAVPLGAAVIGHVRPGPGVADAAIAQVRAVTVEDAADPGTPPAGMKAVSVKLTGQRLGVLVDVAKGTFGDQLLTRSGKWEPLAYAKLTPALQTALKTVAEAHLDLGDTGFWALMAFHLKGETADTTRWVPAKDGVARDEARTEKDAEKLPDDLRTKFGDYLQTVTAVLSHEGNYGSQSPGTDPMASLGIFQWGVNKTGSQGSGSSLGTFFSTLKRRATEARKAAGTNPPTPEQKLYIDAWKQCTDAKLDVDASGRITLNGAVATGADVEDTMAGAAGPMATDALKTYQLVAAMDWIDAFRATVVRPGPSAAGKIGHGYSERGNGSDVTLTTKHGGITYSFPLTAPTPTANVGDLLRSGKNTALAVTLGVNRPHYVEAALWLAVNTSADPSADAGALLEKLVAAAEAQAPTPKKRKSRTVNAADVAAASADYAALQRVIWPAAPTLDAAAEEKLANEFKRRALLLYKASDARKFHRERRFATVEAIFD
jgi:hypothetical protein